jgi:hypothetical protein
MTTKTDAIVRAIALLTARGDTDKAEEYLKWIGTPPKKTTEPRFVPPTLEEVRLYCIERSNGVDAKKFYSHYTSNGWKVGKNKMVDWKAAVRSWEHNSNASPRDNFADYYGN